MSKIPTSDEYDFVKKVVPDWRLNTGGREHKLKTQQNYVP